MGSEPVPRPRPEPPPSAATPADGRATASGVLRHALRAARRPVAGAALLLMAWQVCEALVPVAIGAVIDHAVAPQDGRAILLWLGGLAGLFLVLSLSFRFGSRLARRAAEESAHRLRTGIAGVVLDPRTRPDPARRTGALVSVASADADRVGQVFNAVPRTCAALVSVIVVAVALLRISVPLGLLVLVGSPPLLLLIQRLGGPLERRSGAEQSRAAEAAGLATDLVTGLRVLKGVGGERAAADRYRAASRRSLRATLRAAHAEALYSSATMLLTLCFLALVALVGGRFAAEHRISVGDLVAAVGLAQFLLGPLSALTVMGALLARGRASAARVADVHAAPRHDGGGPAPTGDGVLDVTVDGLHFTARAGEILGIAADTGTAATLIDALADAPYTPANAVHVNETPVAHLSPDAARRTLLVARHDAPLFAETVLTNITAAASTTPAARADAIPTDPSANTDARSTDTANDNAHTRSTARSAADNADLRSAVPAADARADAATPTGPGADNRSAASAADSTDARSAVPADVAAPDGPGAAADVRSAITAAANTDARCVGPADDTDARWANPSDDTGARSADVRAGVAAPAGARGGVLDGVLGGVLDGRVAAAIRAADTDQVAATLPEGLDTVLSERGGSLSGGQRQRVALARALAADPAVLVLHDPTTAVDAATEARVAAGLRALRTGRTTVIVATSPALLAACDRVLLVTDGAVRTEGTHTTLAATDPTYRALVIA